ncbi:MAG: hypothetical protein GY860_17080 [Desulfobacteraceae bacterium]|nr:hypothetical protein [Desulfobacteraceae bacterium]
MSASHICIFCLIFSGFIHWQLLGFNWAPDVSAAYGIQAATIESSVQFQGVRTSFALQQMLVQIEEGPGNTGENRQKHHLDLYVKTIKKEINLNKFFGQGPDKKQLIGNAHYHFTVKGNQKTLFDDIVCHFNIAKKIPDYEITEDTNHGRIMTKWIDQPSIVPFLKCIPEQEKNNFRNYVVERMIEKTKQQDSTCFETFRRVNSKAKKSAVNQ